MEITHEGVCNTAGRRELGLTSSYLDDLKSCHSLVALSQMLHKANAGGGGRSGRVRSLCDR
ncbi:hypothetical protein BM1_07245 [Bipolaris maydis]|nr:hypothetical protein BM1_07245 [Bipolaris maydis]